MVSDQTDFIDNAVGIDPPDCGYTDCLIGNSVNELASMTELMEPGYSL